MSGAAATRARVGPPDLEELLQQSAAMAADTCEARCAAIFLLSDDDTQLLQCVAVHPSQSKHPADRVDGPVLWARVVRQNAPEVRNGPGAFSEQEAGALMPLGASAVLGVPVVIAGRPVGALVAGKASGSFGAHELARAQRAARNISALVERASLYQQATQRIAELSLLHEVGRALNESLELHEILETCADRFASVLDASTCFIMLVDGDTAVCAAATGMTQEEAANVRSAANESSLSKTAIRERRPIASSDPANDPRCNMQLAAKLGEKALLAIPMFHRGRPVGAVVFDERRRKRDFTEAEIGRAELAANHLAAAIDNARLYEDLRKSYAELGHAQARLVQRERLVALGELAAQVAHEVRNPLGAMFNAVAALRRLWGTEGESGYLLGVLGEETERINRIVGDLLDFARPLELDLQPASLVATLREAEASAVRGKEVVVHHELQGRELSAVLLDPRLMRQALLNLFENAIQAMQGRGTLKVRARVVHLFDRPWAEVTVEDSGPGVEASMRQRIFEPFFTTKAAGIGLGLAVVKRIAEAHQGEVSVGDAVGGGAAFTLRWPSIAQKP